MRQKTILFIPLAFVFFLGISEGGPTQGDRLFYSGNSIQMEGLPNFCKVSDDLFRSAQPTLNGMQNLKQIGIKTVVNLCTFHSDRDMNERPRCKQRGINGLFRCHSGLDPESSVLFWTPAFAGVTIGAASRGELTRRD